MLKWKQIIIDTKSIKYNCLSLLLLYIVNFLGKKNGYEVNLFVKEYIDNLKKLISQCFLTVINIAGRF